MKRNAAALLAASILASPAVVFAMAGSNTVNSAAIVDGEVKSSDLGYQAVTSTKIANSAVSDAKISDVGMGKVTGLATALAAKADQAGVDAALATKIDQATLNAALATKADVNHGHFYDNMTVVATSGGEYTNPLDAVGDIGSWCANASAEHHCLMKIMPGVYDLGDSPLILSAYIDVDGAGRATTKLTSTRQSWSGGSVIAYGDNIISNISITSTGSGPDGVTGIATNGNCRIENADLSVSGGSTNTAIYSTGSGTNQLIINNVSTYAHGSGLYGNNVESIGVFMYGALADVKINNSIITSDSAGNKYYSYGVYDARWDADNNVRVVVSDSKVDAGVFHTASLKNPYLALYTNTQVVRNGRSDFGAYYYSCSNVFDENLTPITPCGNY